MIEGASTIPIDTVMIPANYFYCPYWLIPVIMIVSYLIGIAMAYTGIYGVKVWYDVWMKITS